MFCSVLLSFTQMVASLATKGEGPPGTKDKNYTFFSDLFPVSDEISSLFMVKLDEICSLLLHLFPIKGELSFLLVMKLLPSQW